MEIILVILFFIIGSYIYFIPYTIASRKKSSDVSPIFWVNFLLGWTGLFWFVSLIWACTTNDNRENFLDENGSNSDAEELKEFYNLYKEGIISKEEFNSKKRNLLD